MSVQSARNWACWQIDQAAGEARRRHVTDLPGQEGVYLTKLAQAQDYAAAYAADAQAPVPAYIAAEADALGETAITVAGNVIDAATAWNTQAGPAIEAARIGGKAAVLAATGADDAARLDAIDTALAAALAALAQL
jgi:hypothetical protein